VFRRFRDVLAEAAVKDAGGTAGLDAPEDAPERRAWFSFTLAALSSFTRRHFVEVRLEEQTDRRRLTDLHRVSHMRKMAGDGPCIGV
jgi:hypothetical protein